MTRAVAGSVAASCPPLPDWRRAGGLPAAAGVVRASPRDFRVTELLSVEFSNDGEHDWLWLEKTSTNTAWLARRLADFAGVAARDVGYSGRKDRHAVTRQWFSVRRARGRQHDWAMLSLPGVRLLDQVRHRRKLKIGTHRANRFELRLCEVRGDAQDALRRIRDRGVPNYFGEQRFGRGGRNAGLALALFRGARLARDRRSVALSAARAVLFNSVLEQRVADGSWDRLQSGDIAILDGSRSHFAVSTPDETLQARCAAFDLHPSGPLWGRGTAAGPSDAALRHARAAWPELAAGLERHAVAARRALRVRPADLEWQAAGETLELRFTLPAGAFATAVLREAFDYRDSGEAG